MINYHHGKGFDFVPVYAVMALTCAASAAPAVEIRGRILASRMFTHRKRGADFAQRGVRQSCWERCPILPPFP